MEKSDKLNFKTPEIFKDKEASEDTSKQLIIFAYENYERELKKELESINNVEKDKNSPPSFLMTADSEVKNKSSGYPGSNSLPRIEKSIKLERNIEEEIEKESIERKKILLYSLRQIQSKIQTVKSNLKN